MSTAYQDHREKMAKRQREAVERAAEIGDYPKRKKTPIAVRRFGEEVKVIPHELWEQCREDLALFLQMCFPYSTGLKPYSDEQKQVISNQQETLVNGGVIAQALPRGFGKTTITERAALWSVLYGYRKYVACYAANKTLSDGIVDSMKTELETNHILAELFPDVCHAISALEGRANRCKSQTFHGEHTNIRWRADQIILPTMPEFDGSGSVLEAKAVLAARGSKVTSPATGEVLRPDAILVDDPQTDEDAENPRTVDKIVSRLTRSAFMGGGHGKAPAIIMSCTVIEEDDVAERFLNDPNWVSTRYKMMKSMPDRLEDLWLGKYADIKRAFTKDSAESKRQATKNGLQFYIDNREEMDAGAEATWEHCYNWMDESSGEISAIQHAMNILIEKGPVVFRHECQNESTPDDVDDTRLDWRCILTKVVPLEMDVCPVGTTMITGHVDIGESVLNYSLWAWSDDMTGHCIRYATYPEQTKSAFVFRKAPKTIIDVCPEGADIHGAIRYALEEICLDVFNSDFRDLEGVRVNVEALGIDEGYAGNTVRAFIEQSDYRGLLYPMRGKGIGPRMKRISEWRRPKGGGSRADEEWIFATPDKQQVKVLQYDTNYYKSRHAEGWRAPLGNTIGFTLFNATEGRHKMFAQQSAIEKPSIMTHDGVEVVVWDMPVGADNHFLDNNVGAYVLASFKGLQRRASKIHRTKATKKRRVL